MAGRETGWQDMKLEKSVALRRSNEEQCNNTAHTRAEKKKPEHHKQGINKLFLFLGLIRQ